MSKWSWLGLLAVGLWTAFILFQVDALSHACDDLPTYDSSYSACVMAGGIVLGLLLPMMGLLWLAGGIVIAAIWWLGRRVRRAGSQRR